MNEEDIKKLQEENAKLKADNEEFKTSNTKLGEDIKERDEKISTLTQNAQKQGENFKKLREMTAEEKELLSEKEIELLKRQEELETRQAEAEKIQLERDERQKAFIIESLATKYAKGNKDLVEQIKINLGKLNPELLKGALTEQDLTPHVDTAFKMTGVGMPPDPLRTAHNADGMSAPINNENDFSATKDGKDLAGAMGLSQATVEPTK